MLFGPRIDRGAVNQVSKVPRLVDGRTVTLTAGNHEYRRVVADLNQRVGDPSAFPLAGMYTKSPTTTAPAAASTRTVLRPRSAPALASSTQVHGQHLSPGQRQRHELRSTWIKPRATDTSATNTVINGLDPAGYYGMASDYNAGQANISLMAHTFPAERRHRLKTQVRKGEYKRDQHAGTVRFAGVGTARRRPTRPRSI